MGDGSNIYLIIAINSLKTDVYVLQPIWWGRF